MATIKKITDKQGNDIYLRTHTKAVVDDNGYTAESRLQAMQDEINAKQMELGAVPSDLVPTEGSSNWVTSGGVFNKIKQLGNYYDTELVASSTVTQMYITKSGIKGVATTKPTLNLAYYDISLLQRVDSLKIYIPKTGSSAGSLYGFFTELTQASTNVYGGIGNNGSQTIEVDIQDKNIYQYIAVCYDSSNGEPVVTTHIKEADLSDFVNDSELNASYTKTFNNYSCDIKNEYFSYKGTFKTGFPNYKRSDYINIQGISSIDITCSYSSTDASIVAFFSETKSFILAIPAAEQNDVSYSVPRAAFYMIISNKLEGNLSITVSASGVGGFMATFRGMESDVEELNQIKPRKYYNILCIGNSFTNNTLSCIDNILSNLNINTVNINHIYINMASLQAYVTKMNNGDTLTVTLDYGSKISADGTLVSILSHDWDIITFRQVSDSSGNYSSYNPYLVQLINAAKRYCTNPKMKIGFELSWSTYSTTFPSIVSAARNMINDYNIDMIAATGTAVENARLTSMATGANSFSSDTNIRHLANGVGRYVAACCFYETFIKQYSGISIYDDETTVITTSDGLGEVPVTSENRKLCQKCACFADIYKFAILNAELL